MINKLVNFIENSSTAFHAILNVKKELNENNFIELKENKPFKIEKGKKYYVSRNDSSLIAFTIGHNVSSGYAFHITGSHSDSPCFKVKPICDNKCGTYNKISVEPYGGVLCSTWLDRPLSFAGRVFVKEEGKIVTKFIDIKEPSALIPNLCIHFNRQANNGYSYNMAVDMQPFVSQEDEAQPFYNLISKYLKCNKEDIVDFDIYLYNAEKAIVWGQNKEFISSPRLDDLECVYVSLKSFIDSRRDTGINVLAIFDNEEVGSSTAQGANSDFLVNTMKRINYSLKFNEEEFLCAISSSFLISADNAHAVHPNHPSITDSDNKVLMNKGIVIKFNASQSYTSDGYSASIMKELCYRVNVPWQSFTNRSDIRGGSTLGNISSTQVSIKSVDIGLGQLAMHSSFETAGSKDIEYLYQVLREFYNCNLNLDEKSYVIK